MHASLCNLSFSRLLASHNVEADACTSPDKDVMEGRTTLHVRNCRCTIISRIASLPLPSRLVGLVGLYRSWTVLSAGPTNFPSTHSLSVVTLCIPHSTAHHPIALRDELDRLPILLTPPSFYFILQHYCTKSFPRSPNLFAVSQQYPLPRVESTIILQPFRPFGSVSSMLHHPPESPYNCRLISARA
ncbi:hypothetical protein C8Q72DRAFT_142166 [Fomitopsis betulina]|nr:hypothetical protein C8Q72DRAFT_142166 [Fomitopsis betulina]